MTWTGTGTTPGVDRFGPETFGAGQPLGHYVDGENARRAEEGGALDRHDTHRTEADDDHGRTRLDGGPERTDVARGKDVGEEHGRLVGDSFGDRQDELIGERHGDRFGLTAGKIGHRTERGGLVGQAEVREPGSARLAPTAADHPRDQDAVSDSDAVDLWTGFGHRPDRLVAQPDADSGRGVVVQVQVRAADGGVFDGHDHTIGTRKDRIGYVMDRDRRVPPERWLS